MVMQSSMMSRDFPLSTNSSLSKTLQQASCKRTLWRIQVWQLSPLSQTLLDPHQNYSILTIKQASLLYKKTWEKESEEPYPEGFPRSGYTQGPENQLRQATNFSLCSVPCPNYFPGSIHPIFPSPSIQSIAEVF